jgi:O-antigen ligase
MARKRRGAGTSTGPPTHAGQTVPRTGDTLSAGNEAGGWCAVVLALMVFLAPAVGVPHEEMLQDTLKSIVVALGTLVAALFFFWQVRRRLQPLRWHAVLWLPLSLMTYALGSMAWSHTYLAGVETIRWFIFTLLLWLVLNTFSRGRLPLLAWGVHTGALVASLWAVLQFWIDFRLFPQGPNPASTFVNRNFFAEFAVCTLPFSALLLARSRGSARIALLALSNALVIVAILMTGTRSALAAMWLQLLLVLPIIGWLYRKPLGWSAWDAMRRAIALGLLLIAVLAIGNIPSGNPKILAEQRGSTAIERGFLRTASISLEDPSLGVRKIMWKATARMISAHPLSGVGAGAWENEIPWYQADGSQLETDYYAHNEFLQLLAEDGLLGWLFLLLLFSYLIAAAWRTVSDRTQHGLAEAPFRGVLLCSLLALLIVSNVGFPWRMAVTGALFAVCLGALAASDTRLGMRSRWAATPLRWSPGSSRPAIAATVVCLALALYITLQAGRAEQKIVRATRFALAISASGHPNNPKWDHAKAQMLRLIGEGIQINPHYRKITPMVADELANWGDWRDAIWIWESVASSRPYIVAIMSNIARGYAATGNPQRALAWLERARQVQPDAPTVRSLEIILLSRTGREQQALALARQALKDKLIDYELVNATFALAWRAGDYPLALQAMELRMESWPQTRAAGYVQLGNLYHSGLHDQRKAMESYRKALELAAPEQHAELQAQIPPEAWNQLGLPAVPPATAPQMSVISR